MTTRANSGPGKTRHLNVPAHRCAKACMRVIYVNATDSDFWLSASLPGSAALEGKARISQRILQQGQGHCLFHGGAGSGMRVEGQQIIRVFVARSDVSRLRELYEGEDGERLAEAIRNNCSVWFPLKHRDEHHDK